MALTQVKWLLCAYLCVCLSVCKHCSADLCSGYYGVYKSHLLSELWGISTGFHVGQDYI